MFYTKIYKYYAKKSRAKKECDEHGTMIESAQNYYNKMCVKRKSVTVGRTQLEK